MLGLDTGAMTNKLLPWFARKNSDGHVRDMADDAQGQVIVISR